MSTLVYALLLLGLAAALSFEPLTFSRSGDSDAWGKLVQFSFPALSKVTCRAERPHLGSTCDFQGHEDEIACDMYGNLDRPILACWNRRGFPGGETLVRLVAAHDEAKAEGRVFAFYENNLIGVCQLLGDVFVFAWAFIKRVSALPWCVWLGDECTAFS